MGSLVDLSHAFESNMSEALGHRPVMLNPVVSTHTGSHITELDISSHSGTHMDAPVHFIEGGKSIDQFPPDFFTGMAYTIHIEAKEFEEINVGELEKYNEFMDEAKILFISTGWENKWKTADYAWKYPYLSSEAANYIVKKKFKFIGIDTISVDPSVKSGRRNGSPAHKALLGNEILIIENLKGLLPITNKMVRVMSFPLKIKSCDGAPVRVIAEVSD